MLIIYKCTFFLIEYLITFACSKILRMKLLMTHFHTEAVTSGYTE